MTAITIPLSGLKESRVWIDESPIDGGGTISWAGGSALQRVATSQRVATLQRVAASQRVATLQRVATWLGVMRCAVRHRPVAHFLCTSQPQRAVRALRPCVGVAARAP